MVSLVNVGCTYQRIHIPNGSVHTRLCRRRRPEAVERDGRPRIRQHVGGVRPVGVRALITSIDRDPNHPMDKSLLPSRSPSNPSNPHTPRHTHTYRSVSSTRPAPIAACASSNPGSAVLSLVVGVFFGGGSSSLWVLELRTYAYTHTQYHPPTPPLNTHPQPSSMTLRPRNSPGRRCVPRRWRHRASLRALGQVCSP